MAKKTCYRCGATSNLQDVKEGKSIVNVCQDREKCMARKLKSKKKPNMQSIFGL